MSEKRKYIFDEEKGKFNAKSSRYQTKRTQEKIELYDRLKKEYLELQNKLLNSDSYLEEDLALFRKRMKTLKKYFSIIKKKEAELLIPFYIDRRTVVYIDEKNCFKEKWVKMFGEEKIIKRIQEYKKLLPHKPENIKCWNPF